MSDEIGLKAAELLDFPADALLLSLAAERAMNTPNALEIQRLAEQHYPPDWGSEADHSDRPTDTHKKTA
ncbi:hypothetical protein [Marinimicrobium sp. C2-29]|uniref:hypothetical protein n=1 Tax=Marinimicrobium sp. C2-29 TaxID=3139825 RepID=UPI00313971E7